MGDAETLDAMVHDGPTNPFSGRQMCDEATEIGDKLELTRPDLDRWALRSQARRLPPRTRAASRRRSSR
jgi:acetyl-CoA C-acetyltransferase